jgi:hypothetical protein
VQEKQALIAEHQKLEQEQEQKLADLKVMNRYLLE